MNQSQFMRLFAADQPSMNVVIGIFHVIFRIITHEVDENGQAVLSPRLCSRNGAQGARVPFDRFGRIVGIQCLSQRMRGHPVR